MPPLASKFEIVDAGGTLTVVETWGGLVFSPLLSDGTSYAIPEPARHDVHTVRPGGPCQADTRNEVLLLRPRLAKGDQPRRVGDRVQTLQLVTLGNAVVLVAHAYCYGQVAPQAEVVIGEPVQAELIAGEWRAVRI